MFVKHNFHGDQYCTYYNAMVVLASSDFLLEAVMTKGWVYTFMGFCGTKLTPDRSF